MTRCSPRSEGEKRYECPRCTFRVTTDRVMYRCPECNTVLKVTVVHASPDEGG